MRIFVTGGAGYIGSATAAALLAAGHSVTIYDNLSTGYRAAVPSEATFIYGNLADHRALQAALTSARHDAIIHFAASIEAGESMQDPGKYFLNNTANSMLLIETAVASGIEKFVLSSTAAVYQSSDDPLTETAALGPTNVYGETKLMIEQVLRWYGQVKGLRYAALRYFNACGALPGRGEAHQPETHLIPLVLQVALGQRAQIGIFGDDYPTPDGTAIRDYIHIADLATAHVLAVEALNTRAALIYNLGTGTGYSVNEIIAVARKVTGHAIPAEVRPRRAGDSAWLVANPARVEEELGWERQYSDIENIIATAWAWHRDNPRGYRS